MTDPPPDELLFYWRPGCVFCTLLRRELRRAGIPVREINIWDEPAGAAAVRRVARGTETVPTVVIGDVALVNPSMRRVLAVLRDRAPQLIPDSGPGAARPARGNRDWRPALAAVIVALGWLVLALTNPRTPYHLAPLLTAAAWPVVARWMAGGRLSWPAAVRAAIGSAGIALMAALVLAAAHAVRGPALIGSGSALAETGIAIVIGAVLGVFVAAHGARTTTRSAAR